MKKGVIFYISDFGGHSKAAKNIEQALKVYYPEINLFRTNGFAYFFPVWERIIDTLYTFVIKHFPILWGKIYDRKKIVKNLIPLRRFINKRSFKKLDKLIKEFQPDFFIATQAFPCGIVADFKQCYKSKVPLIAVVTDYYPHRFWVHPFIDKYVVACQEAKDILIQEGILEDKISILGIPISLDYLKSYSHELVRQELKLDKELPIVLLMGGGLGIGPIKTVAQQLDKITQSFQIVVVCGRNQTLYRWFQRHKNIFSKPLAFFQYVDFIDKLMEVSEIIITKGGGITVSEALAKSLAIIIINPIPGQEQRNVEHLCSRQAIINVKEPWQVSQAVTNLLSTPLYLKELQDKTKNVCAKDAVTKIVELVESTVK